MPIPSTDTTVFDHTTYNNMEERMTTMLVHQYWDYLMQQMHDKKSHLRQHLNNHDANKLSKDGAVTCLAMTLNKSSDEIQHHKTFTTAIGK